MKFNFRKIASALASAVMVSSTMGFAAAAAWPAPFVTDGVADVAIVYPSALAAADTDLAAANTIQTALNAEVDTEEPTTYTGEGWIIDSKTSFLELEESLASVQASIDQDELDILAEGEFADGEYKQKLTFMDATSSKVAYTVDDVNFDEDTPGLYLYINDETPIFEYDLTFTSPKATSELDDDELSDFVNDEISILGTTYTVTRAIYNGGDIQMDLMGGAEKTTLSNGDNVVIDGHQISLLVRDTDDVVFTVDGIDSKAMGENDVKEVNGVFVAVTDIAYQNYAGGLAQASFFLGGNKVELANDAALTVNDESIDGTYVTIDYQNTTTDEIDLTGINLQINNTKGDVLYIPEGGLLSDVIDEAEALLGGNWDLQFVGMNDEDVDYETIELSPSGDDAYILSFDAEDYSYDLPIAFSNDTGVFAGSDTAKELVMNATNNIVRSQYFIVSNENTSDIDANAQVCVVQYKSSNVDDGQAFFRVLGETTDSEGSFSATTGVVEVNLCDADYTFANTTTDATNFDVQLTSDNLVANGAGTGLVLRTKYNTRIDITYNESAPANGLKISTVVDDTDNFDDTLTTAETLFTANLTEATGEFAVAISDDTGWETDIDNEDVRNYISTYGAIITETASDNTEEEIVVEVPETQVGPTVKMIEGEISVGGDTGGAIPKVTDTAVSSVASKNLIVVAGSCINTAAAKLLGSDDPICEAAFTAETQVGEGGYLIEVFDNPWDTGSKIAVLVAGYEAADTTRAAADFADGISEDIAVGTKIVNPTVG